MSYSQLDNYDLINRLLEVTKELALIPLACSERGRAARQQKSDLQFELLAEILQRLHRRDVRACDILPSAIAFPMTEGADEALTCLGCGLYHCDVEVHVAYPGRLSTHGAHRRCLVVLPAPVVWHAEQARRQAQADTEHPE